jgi:hypothetical protein
MDLGEIVWGDKESIGQAKDKGSEEGSCEHGNEPSGSIHCWEFHE